VTVVSEPIRPVKPAGGPETHTRPTSTPIAETPAALASSPTVARSGDAYGTLISSTFEVALAPGFDPIDLFAAARESGLEPFLWVQPDRKAALVGIGCAWSVEAVGPGRFAAVASAWESRLIGARLDIAQNAGRGAGPVLVGGLGFTGEAPQDPTWVPFGAASMALPELLLTQTPRGSWLTTSFVAGRDGVGSEDNDAPARLERQWRDLLAKADSVSANAGSHPSGRSPLTLVAEYPDRPTWERLIDRLAGAVGRGRLDKVVLAGRADLSAAHDLDVVGALRSLAAGSPNSTTYAVGRGGSVFIGATPERLISTEGREFRTVAMAGSIRHADNATEEAALADELLGSGKDREEHGIVVEMLRAMLEPVASEIFVAPTPVVAAFGTVQHLVTTVTGRLRSRAGILPLAALLHPTPAVGGEPRALALELIAEHETFERGWYAGPLGWVGADGDGELVVALRCAVVSGRTAALFAGCGIVADSDPAREWEESRNKMQVVASALGEVHS
jgi:isochorismate synthase